MEEACYNRIARAVLANSQLVKKCIVFDDGMVSGVINEGIYVGAGSECTLSDFRKDIDSFVYDCNRELDAIDAGFRCNESDVAVSSLEDGLANLRYEFKCRFDESKIELVKTSEWIVDMV